MSKFKIVEFEDEKRIFCYEHENLNGKLFTTIVFGEQRWGIILEVFDSQIKYVKTKRKCIKFLSLMGLKTSEIYFSHIEKIYE